MRQITLNRLNHEATSDFLPGDVNVATLSTTKHSAANKQTNCREDRIKKMLYPNRRPNQQVKSI